MSTIRREHTRADGTFCEAHFSDDEKYRYYLSRVWKIDAESASPRLCNFIMLNPSVADEFKNDPTVERCERRAREYGYNGLIVTNLFAMRSTDPRKLRSDSAPIGPVNDDWILRAASSSDLVVCGWGENGTFKNRAHAVRQLLLPYNVHALKLSISRQPCHPLYVHYNRKPRPITELIPGE